MSDFTVARDKDTAPAALYHYTSFTGALGIISKREIWATNVEYLNDASEYAYTIALVDELVKEMDLAENPVMRAVFQSMIGELRSHQAEQRGTSSPLPFHPYFVACFSSTRDDLSQWRGYGANGGVALEFDPAQLDQLGSAQLINVEYVKERQLARLTEILSMSAARYEEVMGVGGGDAFGPRKRHFIDFTSAEFAPLLAKLAVGLKDPGFKSECEWRLVAKSSPICYRATDSALIPYRVVGLERPCLRAQVGPSANKHLSRKSLVALMTEKRNSFKQLNPDPDPNTGDPMAIEVTESDIPFRDWR